MHSALSWAAEQSRERNAPAGRLRLLKLTCNTLLLWWLETKQVLKRIQTSRYLNLKVPAAA